MKLKFETKTGFKTIFDNAILEDVSVAETTVWFAALLFIEFGVALR